jgi:Spy/CpxP family protein refolding chaperone
MKRIVAVLFAGVVVMQAAGLAFAGCPKDAGKQQEKRVEKMARRLDLSAEQKTKIAAILAASDEKMRAEMQKIREAAQAARAETEQQIKAVLTPEQAQKFEKQLADRKARMEKKKCGAGRCAMPCAETK